MRFFKICSEYFNDELDIEEWKIGNLKILPKKGDLSNPNNWRGINFLDVVSKLMSILLTILLQIVLGKLGTPIQFGASQNTGCPDGSFFLRSMLQMDKEHDIDSWVVFVDLVKGFDSIHHELMFKLLKKLVSLIVLYKLLKNFIGISRSK